MGNALESRPLNEKVFAFEARDGVPCTLVNVRGSRTPDKGPVLLVHGAGVRANIFRAPVRKNFVDYLVELGYDVWLENWRASIDLAPREWTLDDAAVNDHPAAVDKVLALTGAATLRAVVHCQGSTSFTMSALAGLLPKVTTIVSNAVSLHTVVPWFSKWKLDRAVPIVARVSPFLDPRWGEEAPTLPAKLLSAFVNFTHHECDNAVCKWASFTYGSGFPTLWRHENLDEPTHEWLRNEFGAVPLSFFLQMGKCVRRGSLRSLGTYAELPDDFLEHAPKTSARFALFAGELNECFLPEGQQLTHLYLEKHRPRFHSLRLVPGYGHLDIFLGRNAERDVYPLIEKELAA